MSLDELERPIGQHRKPDEETSKQYPKPVRMSIGVAVTMYAASPWCAVRLHCWNGGYKVRKGAI